MRWPSRWRPSIRRTPAPVVVIQARTGSQRLPRKVVTDLCGTPLLAWLVERLSASPYARGLTVATTTEPGDDAVEELCDSLAVRTFRGHPTDVLARYAAAVDELGAEAVVRISGDSPFIDAATLDLVVEDFMRGGTDISENHRTPGWPAGSAIEAITAETVRRMNTEAVDERHREHVTVYAYENLGFTTRFVPPPDEVRAPDMKIYVDTADDLARAREICSAFAPRRDFSISDIVRRFGQ